ncbi:MAG: AAA family ATPase, partial [Verrucomicrobiota bacterium]
MSFLSSLIELDANATLPASSCSALLRQLEQQSMAGLDDPEKPMRMQGQDALVHRLMMAVVLNEHVLLEGLPGVAKTTSVEFVAQDTGLTCRRVQFVPDMQPSDLVGKDQINLAALSNSRGNWNQETRYWENGPIFNNIVIADEINRAPSKVQAALLESMAEKGITPFGKKKFVIRSTAEWRMWMRWIFAHPVYRRAEVWGPFWPSVSEAGPQITGKLMARIEQALSEQHWHLFGPEFPWADRSEIGENTFGATPIDLRNPKDAQFTVFATMNPIELEGTFPLSEAQSDRFCFKTLVKYPSYQALKAVTRMINPPSQGNDPDPALLSHRNSADEALRRSLYFFRRCREVLFGRPGHQTG